MRLIREFCRFSMVLWPPLDHWIGPLQLDCAARLVWLVIPPLQRSLLCKLLSFWDLFVEREKKKKKNVVDVWLIFEGIFQEWDWLELCQQSSHSWQSSLSCKFFSCWSRLFFFFFFSDPSQEIKMKKLILFCFFLIKKNSSFLLFFFSMQGDEWQSNDGHPSEWVGCFVFSIWDVMLRNFTNKTTRTQITTTTTSNVF